MSTLTLLACLAGATLAGGLLGFVAACAWRDLHQPEEVARLTAANVGLFHEVEELERRCWRLEHQLAVWIGLRNAGSVIAVDLRRED